MVNTRSLTIDLVKTSDVPICPSTMGILDSSYVAVNSDYLKLIERVWSEIEHKNLVSEGAAISNPQRDRRLWLLDTQGYYDAETADIRTATGRLVPVKICAQRVWCSGTACDLEFFAPAFASMRDKPAVPAGDKTRKATFSGRLKKSLQEMSLLDKEILVRRILSLTAEGLVLAAHISRSDDIETELNAIIERISSFRVPNPAIDTNVIDDFTILDYNEISDVILQIAGKIWILIVYFKNQEVSEMLKILISGYTVPKTLIVS